MMVALQFAAGFVLLLFGAEYLVRGAVSLARRLKVTPMIIGMTIVAYGTTSPELVVSLQAAVDGLPGISVGNVVGSNIANILLILGASALIYPIVTNGRALYRDAAMMMGSALLFTALAYSGRIERWQGMLMVAILIAFSIYAFSVERRKGKAAELSEDLAQEFKEAPQATWLAVLSVVGGVVAVVAGARLLVSAAVATATALGVGEEVIGLTIVAVGTSLPELATAVVAAFRRHSEVAVGNIMGAGMYNLLAIMGLVGSVTPVDVPRQILVFDLWCMLAVTAMLLMFLLLRGGLSRPVGALFLSGFVAYTVLQYYGVERAFAGRPAFTGPADAQAGTAATAQDGGPRTERIGP
ncbi:MAG TPA: calcium/sodium antiporter [Hyphomicrobiaceae bacterium]|nr:calcium/sodium antiporter [Hyphomicrobiaceae bacterium]